jgi:hypothetical protein
MERKRTLLYGRTSRDKSEGRSVDDQLAELRRWASTRTDVAVIAEHRDDGSRLAATPTAKPAQAGSRSRT